MKKFALLFFSAIIIISCNNVSESKQEINKNSKYQEQLMREGWTLANLSDSELGEEYGINPVYGIQDNYFDITMGEGYNIVVKIVDAEKNKCVRCIVVHENSTTTINQIPQGRFYLKIAYGKDWMELRTSTLIIGKFTRNVFYERSRQIYDFGKKNSREEVNYELKINVKNETSMNNFETTPISEEEYMK